MADCPNCDSINPDSAKFCQECGSLLTSKPNLSERDKRQVMGRAELARRIWGAVLVVLGLALVLFWQATVGFGPQCYSPDFCSSPDPVGYIAVIPVLLGIVLALIPESWVEAMRDASHQHVERLQ